MRWCRLKGLSTPGALMLAAASLPRDAIEACRPFTGGRDVVAIGTIGPAAFACRLHVLIVGVSPPG